MIGPVRFLYSIRTRAPASLVAGAAAIATMFTATPFLLAEIAARYDVSEGSAGAISIAQVGAFAVATILLPRVARPSAKTARISAGTLVVANLVSALLSVFPVLLAVRLVAGLAAGSLTWVAWVAAMRSPGSMGGIASAGPVAALVAAPVMAALADAGGDRAVYAGLALVAVPAVILPLRIEAGAVVRTVSRSRSNRVLLGALFLTTFAGAALFVYESIAAREVLGLSPVASSLGFSLNAAGGIAGARLAHLHRRPGWWLASGGPAAALTVLGGEPWAYFVGMGWWGFAFWMGVPGVMRMLVDRSLDPVERAGDAQGAMAIGRSLGPAIGGVMVDGGELQTLSIMTGVGMAVAGLTVAGVQEGRERLPATDPRTSPPTVGDPG